ncbi:uncharacterized protein At4g14100-like [Lolium rigidum]|uniref:uncharacterized protein At4g14100-like n=1 Tax=Lolium rigidum TaxID=89674 RepID=UPI001F5D13D1|nr:uncharacterized protein At4g14100-like [Lolium rigidum]
MLWLAPFCSDHQGAVGRATGKKMTPLLAMFLLCLQAAHAAAGAAPKPTLWPHQFHATLVLDYHGNLSIADLWYDWPRGLNLHIIRDQLAADAPLYDAQWTNGTSFFYTPARRECRPVAVGVGILRPDWLASGVAYVGRAPVGGFDCHVWTKADFITYYEDVATRRPVKWVFHTTGRIANVMSFEPGAVPEEAQWQAPDYCFAKHGKGTAKDRLISDPDGHDDESFIHKMRMLRG